MRAASPSTTFTTMSALSKPASFVASPVWLVSARTPLVTRSVTRRRQLHHLQARISDALPSYRVALIRNGSSTPLKRNKQHHPPTTTATTKTTTATETTTATNSDRTTTVVTEQQAGRERDLSTETFWRPPGTVIDPFDNRYTVRTAHHAELYTAADIRCEAFYNSPKDAHYHPVRRREIYMAMQSRISAGTCCIVMIDNDPPAHWRSLANEHGLVVATLDVTLHANKTGKRQSFNRDIDDEDGQVCAYISSMAVRRYWQGRGLAQRMLSYTCNFVRDSGVPDLYLHVDWDNEKAVHVYSKHGLLIAQRRRGHWLHNLAKPEHTLMHMPLLPVPATDEL